MNTYTFMPFLIHIVQFSVLVKFKSIVATYFFVFINWHSPLNTVTRNYLTKITKCYTVVAMLMQNKETNKSQTIDINCTLRNGTSLF